MEELPSNSLKAFGKILIISQETGGMHFSFTVET